MSQKGTMVSQADLSFQMETIWTVFFFWKKAQKRMYGKDHKFGCVVSDLTQLLLRTSLLGLSTDVFF